MFLKGHLIEAICHKLLQREAVLSFPFKFGVFESLVRLFVDLKAGSHESISDPIFNQIQRSY